jgi:hypothetical protein
MLFQPTPDYSIVPTLPNVSSAQMKKNDKIQKIGKVEDKRERRWAVLQLLPDDHKRLQTLGKETGHADRYEALLKLIPIVRGMTQADLDEPPVRRPLRLGIPPMLDLNIKAKAGELDATYIRVLLSAARLQIAEAARLRAAKAPDYDRVIDLGDEDDEVSGHQNTKTPNGGMKEDEHQTAKTPNHVTKKELKTIIDNLVAAALLKSTEGKPADYRPTRSEEDEARRLVGLTLMANEQKLIDAALAIKPES